MKTIRTLFPLCLFALLPFAPGCVSDGYVSGGVYYGPRHRPWFHDDPWMDGNRGYGNDRGRGDVYISPPRATVRVPLDLPAPPRLRLP